MASPQYVIGVDGGGTKTLGLLMDDQGRELARESVGSSNIHAIAHKEVETVLRTLVQTLCARAGVEIAQLDGICLGMAGCDSPADREVLQGFLRPILSAKTELTIINDAIVAARAVLGRLHGLLLIAGTGSICFGWNDEKDTQARCGGWGHLLADEGSGYMIGMEALRAVLRSVDGRGPKTVLADRLLAHMEVAEPRGILQIVYGPKGTKAYIAGLSRFVMEADEEGDAVAARILDTQAAELVRLVLPVYEKLFRPEEGETPLGIWGGNLVHAGNYRRRFLDDLAECGLPIKPVMAPDADAVFGAARHALSVLESRQRC
jgi:N-acetylglucosamine kinase-like BadF-type ATPase